MPSLRTMREISINQLKKIDEVEPLVLQYTDILGFNRNFRFLNNLNLCMTQTPSCFVVSQLSKPRPM